MEYSQRSTVLVDPKLIMQGDIKIRKNLIMSKKRQAHENRFGSHPKVTIGIVITLILTLIIVGMEIFLKTFSGLGNPVIYELSPLYGYRPKPNQVIEPKGGMGFLYAARVTINNLGLRAADDWDSISANKILFLGDSVTYGGQYVNDSQLFSSVVGQKFPSWQVGNGGVNAWGVENIVAFVRDFEFIPAGVLVTCVIEGDFYRGLTRAASMPLWIERPKFALQDLLMHYIWKVNGMRYINTVDIKLSDKEHLEKVVDRAVRRLKELDEYLKRKKVKHYIFILPTRSQAVEDELPDNKVKKALMRYEVDAEYLLPKLQVLEPSSNKRREWFHDEVHLEVLGHSIYGKLIGRELSKKLSKQ